MLRSMTAYGRGSFKSPVGELVCEFRSVNHRYLDVAVRLPEPLKTLESALREKLAVHLHRGKVEVVLKLVESNTSANALTINPSVLDSLVDAAGQIESRMSANCVIDTVRLLQWPGLLDASDDSQNDLFNEATSVFEGAFRDFVETREREGLQITALLKTRVAQVCDSVAELRLARPAVVQKLRQKWLEKLTLLDTEHDSSRLEQELVYAAQRLDIDEELDRLDAHCAEIRSALERVEPVGRRLDFLMQECNREANTISAKANDASTTNASVNMKVLIEQMREQVQNIE